MALSIAQETSDGLIFGQKTASFDPAYLKDKTYRDLADFDFWNKSNIRKNVPKRGQAINIRAFIYQCRELPAADAEGTSDPYVTVWDT